MKRGEAAVVSDPSGPNPMPWSSSTPVWRLRKFHGVVMSDADLAATSGPRITVAVAAACVLLSLTVLWKGDLNEAAAGFFPPAGAAVAALAVLPMRRWGWAFVGILVPTLIGLTLGMTPVDTALWWGLANCLQPAVAAFALHRFQTSRWVTQSRMMGMFLVSAVIVGPAIGATFGTIGTVIGYDTSWRDGWLSWALGDGLGVLVVAPLLLTYTTRRVVRRTRRELVALLVLVGGATGLAFANLGSGGAALLPYLILVSLIWAGMRFGIPAAAAAGFVVALGANAATSLGLGPFATGRDSLDAVTLPIFLAIALIASFVVAGLASNMTGRNEVHQLLGYQATHDALTGLPNRMLFSERLSQALSPGSDPATAVAVILFDLDDFKKINDRYGHPAGDIALKAVSRLMSDSVRPHDLLCRLGGDEFVVLCDDLASADEAVRVAQDLARGLDHPIDIDGVEFRLSGSIGVAFVDAEHAVASSGLLRRADIALYHSKRTGGIDGSGVSLFDDALEASTRRRDEMEEELRRAIGRDEMFVAYQPIVSLLTGEVTKFEALARWRSGRFGVVRPDEFIALAEQLGLINEIGEWVLEQACRQTATWRASPNGATGALAATVAVNVSARQLCDADFPDRVRRILADTALPPRALTLEITETAVMNDVDASATVIAELRRIGVALSMDDFGTGYSSMTYLRRIPVESLKIDRTFVAGLGEVREDTAIVESIITLAHSCGLEVVAEGIETADQVRRLIALGCDHGQGYLWSAPVPAADAVRLLDHTFDMPPRSGPVAVAAITPAVGVARSA